MFASIFEINKLSVNDFSHPKRIIGAALMARFEILLFVRIHVPHYTKNFHAALFRKVKEKWMDAAQHDKCHKSSSHDSCTTVYSPTHMLSLCEKEKLI